MRLINTQTLDLEEFYGNQIPRYAILSHTWVQRQEITYQEWLRKDLDACVRAKSGFAKILGACELARVSGHDWLWVDTNCIDKTSSAELSEAINSMYEWYSRSAVCYAYLSDVSVALDLNSRSKHRDALKPLFTSRWWTRGWTLQELLAPKELLFLNANWETICSRRGLGSQFVGKQISGIDADYLIGDISPFEACASEKMSWVSTRETTRDEDMAYCMMGLFQINMPLLYGEGRKAFWRLQEEIIRVSNDHTIFCWSWTNTVPDNWVSMLAPWPDTFANSSEFTTTTSTDLTDVTPYSMTNVGLSIHLPVIYTTTSRFVCLDVRAKNRPNRERARVYLLNVRGNNGYYRSSLLPTPIPLLIDAAGKEGVYAIERLHHFIISFKAPSKNSLFPLRPPDKTYNILLFMDLRFAKDRGFCSVPQGQPLPPLEGVTGIPDPGFVLSTFDPVEGILGLVWINNSLCGGLWSCEIRGQDSAVLILFFVKNPGTEVESWHCSITTEDDISQPSTSRWIRTERTNVFPRPCRETWFEREFWNLCENSIDGAVSAINDGTLRLQLGATLSAANNKTIKSASLLGPKDPKDPTSPDLPRYDNDTDSVVGECGF